MEIIKLDSDAQYGLDKKIRIYIHSLAHLCVLTETQAIARAKHSDTAKQQQCIAPNRARAQKLSCRCS